MQIFVIRRHHPAALPSYRNTLVSQHRHEQESLHATIASFILNYILRYIWNDRIFQSSGPGYIILNHKYIFLTIDAGSMSLPVNTVSKLFNLVGKTNMRKLLRGILQIIGRCFVIRQYSNVRPCYNAEPPTYSRMKI